MGGWRPTPSSRPAPCPFGYPDFAAIREEHFLPAFVEGMARQRAEVDAIAADPAPPTFENTLVALERSGDVLRRVSAVFFVARRARAAPRASGRSRPRWRRCSPRTPTRSCSTPRCSPASRRCRATAGEDRAAALDAAMVRARAGGSSSATTATPSARAPGSARPSRSGCARSTPSCRRSPRSSATGCSPGADGRRRARHRPRPARRPRPRRASRPPRTPPAPAASTATSSPSCCPPSSPPSPPSPTATLRERLHTASVTRGLGGAHDTRATLLAIVALRAERARLLGHPHHASWVVETATAAYRRGGRRDARSGSPRSPPPTPAPRPTTSPPPRATPSPPWDCAFYAERVRRERFAVDAAALRPYLELERVLHDGVFHAADRLYGLQLRRAPRPPDLPPRRARLRRLRRRRRRSACSSPTSTPATPSAAAPG